MIDLIDFSDWSIYEGNSEGSGRSEKDWLYFGDKIGLFKYPKSEYTTEHISEKLASTIAELLEIPCARIDVGTYNGRTGSMSYRINGENEILIEAITFINHFYPNYDMEKLYDEIENVYYSLKLTYPIARAFELEKDFINMILFDALIGNSDRHHSNWAILTTFTKDISFCPLYDNGSSLCCYVNEKDIDSYLGKDVRRFNALVDTRSKSRIRIDHNIKREPTHKEWLEFLYNSKHKNDCIELNEKINQNITKQKIQDILNEYPDNLLSIKRKELISKFLTEKVKIINTVFKGG